MVIRVEQTVVRSHLNPWPAGHSPVADWRPLGRQLRAVLAGDAAYALLPPDATSWVAGGCHTLARALHELLPTATLYLLCGGPNRATQHVVVRVAADGFLDGDGAATRRTLLRRWRTRERVAAPFLQPYDAALLGSEFDPAPTTHVAQLTQFLRAQLSADPLAMRE